MTAAPLDLDALEEFIACADPRSSLDRDAVYVMLRNAAPALFAAARERDKMRAENEGLFRRIAERDIVSCSLREALEAAEAFIAEEWEKRAFDATTRLGPPGIPAAKAAHVALAKARAALGKSSVTSSTSDPSS